MNNWYYEDDGSNLGETTWDAYDPEVMGDMGFQYDNYHGWALEDN